MRRVVFMWKDFKEFAFQGNVVDLAVAVVIGTAFSQIVNSLVENIITPLVGVLFNGINFEHLVYTFGKAEVSYGVFIQSVFDFFVISASIFLFIRLLMKFKCKKEDEDEGEEEAEVEPHEQLPTEISDLIKEKNTID